ncbi:MAG: DNA-binding protein YbiB [Burkholderiales bacterium]|jgi:anthranilate phosphoribosyltransferase
MDAPSLIQAIVRGRETVRGLSHESAMRLFDAIFGGGFTDVELGAVLVALRMRGEGLEEVRAGLDVLEPMLRRVPVDATRPVLAIPSYGGALQTANLVPLLACLLSDAGVQVVLHGVTSDPRRTTTAEIMQAMGLGPGGGVDRAADAFARGDPAFVPIDVLSPRLAALLDLRGRLGVRNVGHMLAALLNPTGASACLRIACFGTPEAGALQRAYFEGSGAPGIVLAGTEGEVVASTRRAVQIDWIRDGRTEVLVPAATAALREMPVLPDPHDASATARWIQSVLAGERPVPPPIELQVGAVLRALDVRPRVRDAAVA